MARRGSDTIKGWPDESREAALLVIDTYGEPHEATESLLPDPALMKRQALTREARRFQRVRGWS